MTYYICAERSGRRFRCYVQLTLRQADLIHDILESECDFVQVCDVAASEVRRSLLLHK